MRDFNYKDFKIFVKQSFLYCDDICYVKDFLEPLANFTASEEDYELIFDGIEEYDNLKCKHMINDKKCREIISECAKWAIPEIKEMATSFIL